MRRVTFLLLGAVAAACGPHAERKSDFVGSPVKLEGTLQCKADQLAMGGFYRDIDSESVEQLAQLTTERHETTWRITFQDDVAEVTRFSGATETLEMPERFTVGQGFYGVILVSERAPHESPQTITIDPKNGSFVYSSQFVDPDYNRANVWYGRCTSSF
jgi:hypothetical protein